ncbi:Cytoplasmic dynein 2 heavy chain 1, partial [Gryllus bimaculatus]
MTMICEDERKDFILTTAAHFFNINVSDGQANDLLNNTNLNEFLDNGSCLILSISTHNSIIMSPVDESSYWASVANSTSRRDLRDRSTAFWNALEPLGKDFSTLNSLSLIDIDDVLETAHNSLDDLWKLDEYPYPQPRMEHLLTITGNALSRFVQSHLKNIHLWEDPFSKVEELISQGINIGEKWIHTCERLTSLFWPNYTPHPWEGPPYSPVYVKNFVNRLQEILRLRTLHRQLIRLLSKSEQLELGTNDSFKPFEGLTPVQYNPYTESEWQTAVQKFESSLRPTEDRVASKLKMQFRSTKTNTLQ